MESSVVIVRDAPERGLSREDCENLSPGLSNSQFLNSRVMSRREYIPPREQVIASRLEELFGSRGTREQITAKFRTNEESIHAVDVATDQAITMLLGQVRIRRQTGSPPMRRLIPDRFGFIVRFPINSHRDVTVIFDREHASPDLWEQRFPNVVSVQINIEREKIRFGSNACDFQQANDIAGVNERGD